MLGKAVKERGSYCSKIITKELKQAAKELREREDIIIRKGDKAAVYVVMNREDYFDKMDAILNNTDKFTQLKLKPDTAITKLTTKVKSHQVSQHQQQTLHYNKWRSLTRILLRHYQNPQNR